MASFWEKVKKGASWLGDKIEQGLEWAGEKIVQGVEWVGEKIEQVGEKIQKALNPVKTTTAPKINTNNVNKKGTDKTTSEVDKIAEVNRRMEMIDEYQGKVEIKSLDIENATRIAYMNTYSDILETLKPVMDVIHIQSYINKKSKVFEYKMRNEINSKIIISNHELQSLMNNNNLSASAYNQSIQNYADKVFNQAKRNLLILLKRTIQETNNYISTNANKFLSDQEAILNTLKVNLYNLSQEGETSEKELSKMSEEYAILQLVESVAKEKIS